MQWRDEAAADNSGDVQGSARAAFWGIKRGITDDFAGQRGAVDGDKDML